MKIKTTLVILTILTVIFSHTTVFAQTLTPQVTSTTSPTQAPKKVEYALPYPGMLPDNPLYFTKAFRDRLIGLLINDPLKKAQFNLLTSDKRLNAAIALLAKGKQVDAVSVVSKSNNYFELALESCISAQKNRENVRDILLRMQTSSLKHQEIVKDMMVKVDKKYRSQLAKEADRLVQFNKTIARLLKSGV